MSRTALPSPVFLSLSLVMAAVPAAAQARVALNEEEHINTTLVSAAVGALIAENCDRIEPRKFTAMVKAWQLKNYALSKGYTGEEIDAFLRNRDENKRVRMAAEAYLVKNGVVAGDAHSYCTIGLAEIEDDTLTGQLLWAN